MPKHDNTSLTFFALSELGRWHGDCKKSIISSHDLWFWWFLGFCFILSVVNKKNLSQANIKSWCWLLWGPYVCWQCDFGKISKFWFGYELLKFLIFRAYSVCGQLFQLMAQFARNNFCRLLFLFLHCGLLQKFLAEGYVNITENIIIKLEGSIYNLFK